MIDHADDISQQEQHNIQRKTGLKNCVDLISQAGKPEGAVDIVKMKKNKDKHKNDPPFFVDFQKVGLGHAHAHQQPEKGGAGKSVYQSNKGDPKGFSDRQNGFAFFIQRVPCLSGQIIKIRK